SLSVARLTNQTVPVANDTCQVVGLNPQEPPASAFTSTAPNSRHSYNGLAYVDHLDKMFVVAGSLASNCGAAARPADMWLFAFATNTWSRINPVFSGVKPGDPQFSDMQGYTAVYHPTDQVVYFHDQAHLFRYNPADSSVVQIGQLYGIGYHTTAVLD